MSGGPPGQQGGPVDALGGIGLTIHSEGRALLMLFLFSDVTEDDAPTRIRFGSHRDVPPVPAPYGDTGAVFLAFAAQAVPATEHRPVSRAGERRTTCSECHPFLVYAGPRTGAGTRDPRPNHR